MSSDNKTSYFPPSGSDWRSVDPVDAGLDSDAIQRAIEIGQKRTVEPYWGDDYAIWKSNLLLSEFGPAADVEMVGPFIPPTTPNGLILRHGMIVGEFGDIDSVSEIASATKSFISTVAGLAFDRGLIRNIHDKVSDHLDLEEFSGLRNSQITWHHLLQQNSEWEGSLFGKVTHGHNGARVGEELHSPGTYFEYNDVRVNLLSYALLHLWKRPLPEVLKEFFMDPIGASETWEWHGYRTSKVMVDGETLNSVSGGSHWGGGIWMSSRDLARYGHLYLRNGLWMGKRVLSQEWIRLTRMSNPSNYMYGYLWWLKHDGDGRQIAYAAEGGGGHSCTVIPDYDMVVVGHWIEGGANSPYLDAVFSTPVDVPRLGKPIIDFSRVNSDRVN